MASRALGQWETAQSERLDQLVTAHHAVGGEGPGRRYATEQINHAYLLAVAAQFQGFCRDLHSEAAAAVVAHVQPLELQPLVSAALTQGRQLDRGNANAANIGADFGLFDMKLWDVVYSLHALNRARRKRLDQLNVWRNAIAHQDFNFSKDQSALIVGTTVGLKSVRGWRAACDQLAKALDKAVGDHLEGLVDRPW